jgi:hypothetical protein
MCTARKAANKEELLEMITHGAEKIVNSTEAYVFAPIPSLAIFLKIPLIASKLTMISMQLSSAAKSVPQRSTRNTRV